MQDQGANHYAGKKSLLEDFVDDNTPGVVSKEIRYGTQVVGEEDKEENCN